MVWADRFAHDRGDAARVKRPRKEWSSWQGEESLHEMAFGEPIDPAAFHERLRRNKREPQRLKVRREASEAEIAWLELSIVISAVTGADAPDREQARR
jgi:hypothetical protein